MVPAEGAFADIVAAVAAGVRKMVLVVGCVRLLELWLDLSMVAACWLPKEKSSNTRHPELDLR